MQLEIIMFGVTGFFVYNAYTDGKGWAYIMSFKKQYEMGLYLLIGIGIYCMMKRDPRRGKAILENTAEYVKYLPLSRSSIDMFAPVVDFTSSALGGASVSAQNGGGSDGARTKKRVVSETKKKYVASAQGWKCGHCQHSLDHTFEIDHKLRLEYGGDNEVRNLVALCRNCHGKKTASENM